jgi:hypothetical protein
VVDGAREHARQLGRAHARLEARDLPIDLGQRGLVVLGRAQLEQDPRVVEVARQLLDARDLRLEGGALAGDDLRLLLVVPEPRGQGLLLELVYLALEPGEVKDAPLAP